jgi:hypothetical protein
LVTKTPRNKKHYLIIGGFGKQKALCRHYKPTSPLYKKAGYRWVTETGQIINRRDVVAFEELSDGDFISSNFKA